MGDSLITAVVSILMAIVGVAIIAVLVSKNANTTGVISAGGSAFSGALGTALSPVTGGGFGSFTGGGAGFGTPSF
jgi:acid phosphatase family membrane protein YuiD